MANFCALISFAPNLFPFFPFSPVDRTDETGQSSQVLDMIWFHMFLWRPFPSSPLAAVQVDNATDGFPIITQGKKWKEKRLNFMMASWFSFLLLLRLIPFCEKRCFFLLTLHRPWEKFKKFPSKPPKLPINSDFIYGQNINLFPKKKMKGRGPNCNIANFALLFLPKIREMAWSRSPQQFLVLKFESCMRFAKKNWPRIPQQAHFTSFVKKLLLLYLFKDHATK